MSKYFRFKAEVGWAELLSSAALAVAGAALWQSAVANNAANEPRMSIAPLVAESSIGCDPESGVFKTLHYIVLRFTNSGGRTATLLRLQSKELGPVLAERANGVRRVIPSSFFILDSLDTRAGFELPSWRLDSLVRKSRALNVEVDSDIRMVPTLLGISIAPGESKLLPIAFRSVFGDVEGQIGTYFISMNAEFASGPSLPIDFSVPNARARGNICSNIVGK